MEAAMERHLMVVMTNSVEGRDAEYNAWYDHRHLADVLKIPGIVSAERFELSEVQRSDPPYPYRYLALYWVETDDLSNVITELRSRSGTSLMPLSDALAPERSVHLFKPRA
jgi:hypothetical protein